MYTDATTIFTRQLQCNTLHTRHHHDVSLAWLNWWLFLFFRCGREDLKLKISEMEAEKKAMEPSVNLPALEQYRKREEEYHGRVQELEEATVARKEARE